MNMRSTTALTPMIAGPAPRDHYNTFPIAGMRLLDGESEADKATRLAAEAETARLAKEASDAAAAEAARIQKEKDDAEAADAAEKARLAQERKDGKLTDKEFELLTDAMKHKATAREAKRLADEATAKLKAFEGIDPAKIRDLIKAEETAKAAQVAAELKAAEKAGDVERIKAMMAEEHTKVVTTLETTIKDKDAALDVAQNTISDLTVGAAFSNSTYIKDELVLTPHIARQVYSSYFDVVDRKVVAFDKPRGEAGRTPLTGADGKGVGFEDAIKKIVEAQPDKDSILKSKLGSGAQSRTEKGNTTENKDGELKGAARIAAALSAGAFKKAAAK
jgi:hypothetical protein